MFDQSFPYRLIQKTKLTGKDILSDAYYSFNSSYRRYIVLVEEYPYDVFVPKFYPSTFKNSPHKFNILVNDFEVGRIVRTCINIMLAVYRENPGASFAFVGAETITKHKKENKIFTQRYRVYKRVMLEFFNTDNWYHYDDMLTSTYLLIAKTKPDVETYLKNVIAMFANIYPDIENVDMP